MREVQLTVKVPVVAAGDDYIASAPQLETSFDVKPTSTTWTTGDLNGDAKSDFVELGATPSGLGYQVELSGSGPLETATHW